MSKLARKTSSTAHRVEADRDVDALLALGAKAVVEVRDEAGDHIGYDVEPEINMAGYPAALAVVEVERTAARWGALRAERARRLAACDWTQLPDAGLSETRRAAWAAYRRALRDLPEQTQDPNAPAWPSPPA